MKLPQFSILAAGVGLAMLSAFFWFSQGSQVEQQRDADLLVENPPAAVFAATGQYSWSSGNLSVAVHTVRITPDYIALTYSMVCPGCGSGRAGEFSVTDDRGHVYKAEGTILASTEDVTVGWLVTEPYVEAGSVISLVGDGWRIDFLKNNGAGSAVDFVEGGRLAPEEGVVLGEYRFKVDGPPGANVVKLDVINGADSFSAYGHVDSEMRSASAMTAAEYFTRMTAPETLPAAAR